MSIFGSSTEVADREAKNKIYGVVIGIVVANVEDKAHTYRVKVRFPWLEDGGENDKPQEKSWWARISSFSAGEYIGDDNSLGPRGALFLPEIGDEVLVAFEHGDISRPIVLGRLWSDVGPESSPPADGKPNRPVYSHTQLKGKFTVAVDDGPIKPHAKTKHEKSKNDLSGLRTRSGHVLVFNDNKEEQAIYLRTAQSHRIELVDGGKQGILIADPAGNYVWLKSGAQNGDIEMYTAGTIKMTAKQDIIMEAQEGKINITSTKGLTKMVTGTTFDVDAKGAMTLKTSASGRITASSELKLEGHPINLN